MLSTLCLLASLPFVFTGGSPNELAASFFGFTREPVAIVAVEKTLPAMRFEAETPRGAVVQIAKFTPLRIAEDQLHSFGFDAWPAERIWSLVSERKDPFIKDFPALEPERIVILDGKVKVEPRPDRYVTLGRLAKLKWTKPLKVHWIVANIPVAVRAEFMPEEKFLRMVASAACAKLVIGSKSIDAQPDLADYRRTRLAALEAKAKQAEYRWIAARLRAQIGTLREVTDENLRKSIAYPNSIEHLEVASISPLGQVGLRFLADLKEIERTLRPNEVSSEGIFGLIADPPVVLIRLDGNGDISVMFAGKRPNSAVSP